MSDHVDILEGVTGSSPWRFQPPASTVLLIPMAGATAPAMESVLQPLADFTGQDLEVQGAEPPDGSMAWFVGCTIEGLPNPIAMWCEPAGELEPHYDTVVGPGHEWTVVLQTQLTPRDPLTHYINLVRLIACSMPDTAAILDPQSGHWLERSLIESAFLSDRQEPQEDVLWRIDVIDSSTDASEGNWIRTVGLDRCGRAELECIGVPPDRTQQAVELLSSLAALSLELALPESGVPLEIGPNLRIQLIDTETATASLDAQRLGSMSSRAMLDDPDALAGIVCGTDTNDLLYPEAALAALGAGDVTIYRTERRTRQETVLAQDTWPALLAACRTLIEQDVEHECLIQVPFEQSGAEQELREHLWLSIVSVTEDTADAVLVHEPRIVQGIEPGWTTTIEVDEISGWILNWAHGQASPMNMDPLHALLPDAMKPE